MNASSCGSRVAPCWLTLRHAEQQNVWLLCCNDGTTAGIRAVRKWLKAHKAISTVTSEARKKWGTESNPARSRKTESNFAMLYKWRETYDESVKPLENTRYTFMCTPFLQTTFWLQNRCGMSLTRAFCFFVFVLTTLVNSDYAASINIIHEKIIRKERSGCGLIQVLQQHMQTYTNSLGHNMVISLFWNAPEKHENAMLTL